MLHLLVRWHLVRLLDQELEQCAFPVSGATISRSGRHCCGYSSGALSVALWHDGLAQRLCLVHVLRHQLAGTK